jgi:hypothetical protein
MESITARSVESPASVDPSHSVKTFPSTEEFTDSQTLLEDESREVHDMGMIVSIGSEIPVTSWLELVSAREIFRMRYIVNGPVKPGFRGGLKWWKPTQKTRIAWADCWVGESPDGVNLDLIAYFYSDRPRMIFRFESCGAGQQDSTKSKLVETPIGGSYTNMRDSSAEACWKAITQELQLLRGLKSESGSFVDLSWMTESVTLWYGTLIRNIVMAALQDMVAREGAEVARGQSTNVRSEM